MDSMDIDRSVDNMFFKLTFWGYEVSMINISQHPSQLILSQNVSTTN